MKKRRKKKAKRGGLNYSTQQIIFYFLIFYFLFSLLRHGKKPSGSAERTEQFYCLIGRNITNKKAPEKSLFVIILLCPVKCVTFKFLSGNNDEKSGDGGRKRETKNRSQILIKKLHILCRFNIRGLKIRVGISPLPSLSIPLIIYFYFILEAFFFFFFLW